MTNIILVVDGNLDGDVLLLASKGRITRIFFVVYMYAYVRYADADADKI